MTPLTDLDEANRQLLALHKQLAAEVEARAAEVEEKNQRIAELTEQLAYLQRQMFGRRRESLDPNQLALFDRVQDELQRLIGSSASKVQTEKPAKSGHGRAPFSPDIPRETTTIDLPEEERLCPDCGEPLKKIGTEVTERGHIIPARMCVKRYERHKYA